MFSEDLKEPVSAPPEPEELEVLSKATQGKWYTMDVVATLKTALESLTGAEGTFAKPEDVWDKAVTVAASMESSQSDGPRQVKILAKHGILRWNRKLQTKLQRDFLQRDVKKRSQNREISLMWAEIYQLLQEKSSKKNAFVEGKESEKKLKRMQTKARISLVERLKADPHASDYVALADLLDKGDTVQVGGSGLSKQELYIKALEIDPDYATAYSNLGKLTRRQPPSTVKLGDEDHSAKSLYIRALELDPTLWDTWRNLRDELKSNEVAVVGGIQYNAKKIAEHLAQAAP